MPDWKCQSCGRSEADPVKLGPCETCGQNQWSPIKPGSPNPRIAIPGELHSELKVIAKSKGMTLRPLVVAALWQLRQENKHLLEN